MIGCENRRNDKGGIFCVPRLAEPFHFGVKGGTSKNQFGQIIGQSLVES